MATVLPALVTGLVLAGSPALRYSSSLRVETVVRAPNLTEFADRPVLEDLVLTPRGQAILYTGRMELKLILEPQILLRRAFYQPTPEVLTFAFLRGEYQVTRGLKLWGLESLTYGVFPFEDFRVPATTPDGNVDQLDSSQYVYSETMVGFDVTGLRRAYIGAYATLVYNGLLEPTPIPNPRRRLTPGQVGPELRAQAFYSFTRRFVGGLHLYGRDVHFSTAARVSLLHSTGVLQYQFHPLINGRLEAGAVVGERRPQRSPMPLPYESILHPVGEAALTTPVPVGYHWPVEGKLSVRYMPYVNVFTTAVYPRVEEAFSLKWEGRRKAQVNLELAAAQSMDDGFHRRDGEERLALKIEWPLTRSTAAVASGRLLRLREFLIDGDPIYKWFAGVGLVIRQENGRL